MASRAKSQGSDRVVLFAGPEMRAKEEALAAWLAEHVPAEDRDLDVEYIDASAPGFAAAAVLQAARDRGMFSSRRVVIVRHAEALRDARHERGRELLAQQLPSLPQEACLLFVTGTEEEGGRGGPVGEKLAAAIRQVGQVRSYPLLRPEEAAGRVRQHVAAAGKRIAPAAAALLARRAGPGLNRILSEADKLVSYAGDRPEILDADILALVPGSVEESVFALLNHAAMGNRRQAVESLQRLLDGGEAPARVLPMLSRTLRQLVQAKYLQARRVAPQASRADLPEEVRSRLPDEGDLYQTAAQPWQRERLWSQAARLTWEHLRAAVDHLAFSDAGTKGWEAGAADPGLALELFVIRISERRWEAPGVEP
jgi:DNA polymerase III subunit delta